MYKSGTDVPLFFDYKKLVEANALGHHLVFLRIELARTVVLVSPTRYARGLWLAPKLLPKVYFVTFVFTYVKYATLNWRSQELSDDRSVLKSNSVFVARASPVFSIRSWF